MLGGACMINTKTDACDMINAMSDVEFSQVREFLNEDFFKSAKKKVAEVKFIAEIKAAEESVANGNYVTSSEIHEFLGV